MAGLFSSGKQLPVLLLLFIQHSSFSIMQIVSDQPQHFPAGVGDSLMHDRARNVQGFGNLLISPPPAFPQHQHFPQRRREQRERVLDTGLVRVLICMLDGIIRCASCGMIDSACHLTSAKRGGSAARLCGRTPGS